MELKIIKKPIKINPFHFLNEPDAEKYLEDYEQYISRSDKHYQILSDFSLGFKKVIKIGNSKTINILDIGCGPGQLTSLLLKSVKDLLYEEINDSKTIFWDAIDPCKPVLELCKTRCKDIRSKRLRVHFYRSSIEEYMNGPNDCERYDYIICSHVLYYVSKWEKVISSLISALCPGGELLIAQASKEAELYYLLDKVKPFITNKSEFSLLSAEEVELTLKKTGISYIPNWAESKIIFSREEIENFINEEENIHLLNIFAFLWKYSVESLDNYSLLEHLRFYFRNKSESTKDTYAIQHFDGIFRIKSPIC